MTELRWLVIQPINGKTDWYDLAAFASLAEAREWRDQYNGDDLGDAAPLGWYPAEVVACKFTVELTVDDLEAVTQ